MFRKLGESLSEYLQSIGINPLYMATIVGIIISSSYIKYFETWEEEPFWRKMFVVGTFFGTASGIFFSILTLLGIMRL